MESGKYYVLANGNNLFEGMTKEQIIAAIVEATGTTPTDIDNAFITKIKEQNKNAPLQFWIGTQAEYNALTPVANVFYIISDEQDYGDIQEAISDINEDINALQAKTVNAPILRNGLTVTQVDNKTYIKGAAQYRILIVHTINGNKYMVSHYEDVERTSETVRCYRQANIITKNGHTTLQNIQVFVGATSSGCEVHRHEMELTDNGIIYSGDIVDTAVFANGII